MTIKLKLLIAFGLNALLLLPLAAQTNDTAAATESEPQEMADIAKKLNNPVASLISVPLQNNFDFGGGLYRRGNA